MICLLDAHDLNSGLSRHLANEDLNETIHVRTYALLSANIKDAFNEMRILSLGARTAKPGVHAILSPSIAYNLEQWDVAWLHFEQVVGLEDQPFVEVKHLKFGRGGRNVEHSHRIYSRIDDQGKVIGLSHIAAKAEKVSRLCEVANGERLTSGRWNRAVIENLESEGRNDIANMMRAAGFWEKERPETTSRAE